MMSRRGTLQRFYVESDYYFEQLRQIVRTFRLERSLRVFSRCLQCNTALEPVAKTLVGDRVPEYVLASQTAFKQCAKCHRFYWGGTHRDNMLRQLQVMLSGLLSVPLETSH
jgi:uncharacterized protein with PIN domain